jgi:ribokinase
MKKLDFVGWGAMNYDRSFVVDKIVENGEQLIVSSIAEPGGSAANTVYGLAKLGFKSGFIGAVGSDEIGEMLIRDLTKVKVDVQGVKIKKGQTSGTTLCISDRSGKRSIYLESGANKKLTSGDIELSYLQASDFLHISSFVDDQQFSLQVKAVKEITFKPKISFSPGIIYSRKGMRQLIPILKKTNVLFINKEEIETLTGEKFAEAAKLCIREGCRIVAVTLGKGIKRGKSLVKSYINEGGNEYYIETILKDKSSNIASTGTGDAFATGFLFGLVTNKEIYECAQLGEIVSNFGIRDTSARSGLPTLATLSAEYLKLANLELT